MKWIVSESIRAAHDFEKRRWVKVVLTVGLVTVTVIEIYGYQLESKVASLLVALAWVWEE